MPKTFVVFANVPSFTVKLATDFGWSGTAVPGTDPQGRAGQVLEIPDGIPQEGAQVNLDADGKVPIQQRGILTYPEFDPTRAYLLCDDFVFVDMPVAPEPPPTEPPPTPMPSDPLGIINAVYATGQFNLQTQSGCGTFTEECCRQLAATIGNMWGHVFKNPGQNQWNKHAVDAVHALYGEYAGIWDIITSSVSSSARPAFNDAGDVNPEIWRPPEPLPCEDLYAHSRSTEVRIYVDVALDELRRHVFGRPHRARRR